jgi:F420-non-reducing hydrogenase iron-sulfur subunit
MAVTLSPDVIVYVCGRSIPKGATLRRQWKYQGVRVAMHTVPCSGKMDGQYLLHALEGGARGLCVVTCPKGECHLSQGNYRAEIRIRTIRRLLGEAGLEPERAELLHSSPNDAPEQFEAIIRGAVERICALGESPLCIGNSKSRPIEGQYSKVAET